MLLARTAGCRAILVRTGWGEGSLGPYRHLWAEGEPDFIARDILEQAEWKLGRNVQASHPNAFLGRAERHRPGTAGNFEQPVRTGFGGAGYLPAETQLPRPVMNLQVVQLGVYLLGRELVHRALPITADPLQQSSPLALLV
jgi:hypothetical protein